MPAAHCSAGRSSRRSRRRAARHRGRNPRNGPCRGRRSPGRRAVRPPSRRPLPSAGPSAPVSPPCRRPAAARARCPCGRRRRATAGGCRACRRRQLLVPVLGLGAVGPGRAVPAATATAGRLRWVPRRREPPSRASRHRPRHPDRCRRRPTGRPAGPSRASPPPRRPARAGRTRPRSAPDRAARSGCSPRGSEPRRTHGFVLRRRAGPSNLPALVSGRAGATTAAGLVDPASARIGPRGRDHRGRALDPASARIGPPRQCDRRGRVSSSDERSPEAPLSPRALDERSRAPRSWPGARPPAGAEVPADSRAPAGRAGAAARARAAGALVAGELAADLPAAAEHLVDARRTAARGFRPACGRGRHGGRSGPACRRRCRGPSPRWRARRSSCCRPGPS